MEATISKGTGQKWQQAQAKNGIKGTDTSRPHALFGPTGKRARESENPAFSILHFRALTILHSVCAWGGSLEK